MLSLLIFILLLIVKASEFSKISVNKINENLKNDKFRRILQEETDTDSFIIYKIYNISNINYTFENQKLFLYVDSIPELPYYVNFLVKLKIDKYNNSFGYWDEKEIDVRASFDNSTSGVYSAFVDEINLDNLTMDINVTISNVSVLSYDNNIYYYEFTQNSFYFYVKPYKDTTIETTELSDSLSNPPNIPPGGGSSGSKSIGIIIGIIAAALAIIGIIVGVVIYCYRKKKSELNKASNFNETTEFHLKSKVEKSKEDLRTLVLTTQKQDKKTIVINADKNMKDLRRKFFEAIKQPELIEEKSILFLYNGKGFNSNSNDLIKDIFKNNNDYNIVIIVDNDDKINDSKM